MTNIHPGPALEYLRRLAGDRESSDGELLRSYLESGDQEAFAALVRRHGPMVSAVCRSVLRDRHASEDTFQAAFLILARRAGSIREAEGVGGWLHRVAYRVSVRARAAEIRRQKREATAARPAASADDLPWRELRAILHEEIGAMPGPLRAPLVLCYLEGLTQEEAAARLELTPTTVKGRLQRGREGLRRRLERRGVALTAALAATLTAEALAAPAVRVFHPEAATVGAVELAREFQGQAVTMKLATLSAVVLSAGLLAAGVSLLPAKRLPAALPTAAGPAVDAHGDPLPEGAVARLGTLRFNHGEGVRHLFFSPDGKTVISEGGGKLRLWDAANGKERANLASPGGLWKLLALSPNGKKLVTLSQEWDGKDVVSEYDLVRIETTRTLPLPTRRSEWSRDRENAISPDGKLGAVNLPHELDVVDLATGLELHKLAKGGKDIRAVAFAGRDRLVTADAKNVIDIWDARTGRPLLQFAHGAPVGVLASSADGRCLATMEHHNYAIDRMLDKDVVRLWDLNTGAMTHTLAARPKRWFMGVRFSPDGKRLVTSSFGYEGSEITVWDVESGQRGREIGDAWNAFAVSQDGKRLAVGGPMVEVWDLNTGRLAGVDGARARAIAYSPVGDRIVLLGHSSVGTWDATTGRLVDSFSLPKHPLSNPTPSLSHDGRLALSFTWEGDRSQGGVWDVAGRRRLYDLKAPIAAGAFSHDSSLLATWEATEKEVVIRLREGRTGKEIRVFPAGLLAIPSLHFTADGKTLFAVGKNITGYEVASGKELFSWRMKPIPDHSGAGKAELGGKIADPDDRFPWRGFALSQDGTLVAVTLDGGFGGGPTKDRLALFDARTGRLVRRWSDSGKAWPDFDKLCFSPDGRLLASTEGPTVRLWETGTGKPIYTFRGHRNEINFLAFSRDGRRLSSASGDSTVLIWNVTRGR